MKLTAEDRRIMVVIGDCGKHHLWVWDELRHDGGAWVSPAELSHATDSLVARGLITKDQRPNGQTYYWTDAGRAALCLTSGAAVVSEPAEERLAHLEALYNARCHRPWDAWSFEAEVTDQLPDLIAAARSLRLVEAERDELREALAAETEACAKVAETMAARARAMEKRRGFGPETATPALHEFQCESIAAAIRSRTKENEHG